MSLKRKVALLLCLVLTPVLLVAALLIGGQAASVDASSHREAPMISKDPNADTTDLYAYIPRGKTDSIVLAANWIPFEAADGGPNYFEFDDSVYYEIHVDNDGDAIADRTYRLSSHTVTRNPNTFLYNTGPINSLADTDWNRPQYYTVTEILEGGTQTVLIANKLAPPVNIGGKSTPNYEALANAAVYTSSQGIKIFAGQRDDPFWVDLQIFDLLTLRGQDAPIGYAGPNNIAVDSLAGFNVHSFILEIPLTRLKEGNETVLGVWATSARVPGTVLGALDSVASPEAHVQISRLGMPLTNEVVLPLGLKDTFNTLKPSQDLSVYGLLQESVEDPEVGNLLCALYGVKLPKDADNDCDTAYTAGTPATGRVDIFDIFLRGMVLAQPFTVTTSTGATALPAGFNINRPAGVQPAEMLRINTAISGNTCHPMPQRLGVLAGDACGFPNGRRLIDDVIDIELLAVAGAAYEPLAGNDTAFAFNGALIGVLDDNLNGNDKPFMSTFPYMATPHAGDSRQYSNIFNLLLPVVKSAGAAILEKTALVVSTLSFGLIQLPTDSAPSIHGLAAAISLGLVGSIEWLRRRRSR
ncbi:MAG: DUF4331 domain-containing protein [Ardenticatenales bacterium]|nr:DUF4331 domain-containing protein [Ardenticatenales bacterium]